MQLHILVATMSGTAESVAQTLQLVCSDSFNPIHIHRMETVDSSIFDEDALFLICSSTYGSGDVPDNGQRFWPYTLNEVSVHRSGAALLGIDVTIDGHPLPTYWADGLLVATSSGSTAYSLSVGGPICAPEAKVLIIAPIAPHNLNARPLVVPDTTRITVSMRSRDDGVMLSMDNRNHLIQPSATLDVKVAQFSLKRVRLKNTSFIKALTTKLFWGEDIRNSGE